MSQQLPESIVVNTTLLGKRCRHTDGSGTIEGTICGVFIHRDSAGVPQSGFLVTRDDGTVHCRYVGTLVVLPRRAAPAFAHEVS